MANRVLIGNRTSGGYGLYVSKANSNVLTCDDKDLLFSSNQKVSGAMPVYAGGSQSSLSGGLNFLTTGSKDDLGYIPLVIATENENRVWNWGAKTSGAADIQLNQNNVSMFTYTSSTITPALLRPFPANNITGMVETRRTSISDYGSNTGGTQACTGLEFVVLKMPCAFGHMSGFY
tara:strand:+ start:13827 stop:14354 length:528 start_codon:yes stop_codon:yes gene_type:complete